jgi:hypothetical protein
MDETRYIRGRKVVFERKEPVETLRYSLDVFDARDNLVEVLGRVADLSVAQAAFDAAVAKYPRQAHLPALDVPRDPQQREAARVN